MQCDRCGIEGDSYAARRPDPRARPEVVAHSAQKNKMATNAVASDEMRLEPRDRTKCMELVSSCTIDDTTTDFTVRTF